jgi:hypothetical protein
MGEFEATINRLVDAGLLTRKQAVSYLGIKIDHAARYQVSEHLGIEPSTLDTHTARASEKIEAAERTLDIIDEYERDRYPPAPDSCDECGSGISGAFARTEDGRELCRDCTELDLDSLDGVAGGGD